MTNDLRTPETRAALAARREPYWENIVRGVALGYRRGARGGTWHVRWRDFGSAKRFQSLGAAEDGSGHHGLSYEEAKELAINAAMRALEVPPAEALEVAPVENESEDRISVGDDPIDKAAVQRVIDATRSSRFQPPAIDLADLAEDLRSVREAHRRRAREAPQVAADFQDLVNATATVLNIYDRITSDETRKSMLLEAIALRNRGSLSLPDLELRRLIQCNSDLQFLARDCAETSRVLNEFSDEMGTPNHYFLLARALPRVFEKHFHRPFGRSTNPTTGQRTGPGVRFVMAAAALVGIRKPDGKFFSAEILRTRT